MLSVGPFKDDIFSHKLVSAACFLMCFADYPGTNIFGRNEDNSLARRRPRERRNVGKSCYSKEGKICWEGL